jgi:hypothetical protein
MAFSTGLRGQGFGIHGKNHTKAAATSRKGPAHNTRRCNGSFLMGLAEAVYERLLNLVA